MCSNTHQLHSFKKSARKTSGWRGRRGWGLQQKRLWSRAPPKISVIPGGPLAGLWGSHFHIWPEPHQNQGPAHFQNDLFLELPEYLPLVRNLLETSHPRFISTIEWRPLPAAQMTQRKDRHRMKTTNSLRCRVNCWSI